jgi:alpha-D-ribose 1-methylphosphonate 5-triphosphate synthase subunit PhnL
MHVLVQLKGKPEVYVSDFIHLRWVPNAAALKVVQAQLKARGLPTTVTQVTSLDAYGLRVQ